MNYLESYLNPYIVVGDFNFSSIDWDTLTGDLKSREFLSTVQDLFLTQHIKFPTHLCGTMPDLVLSSNANLIISTEDEGPLGSSDHTMISIIVRVSVVSKSKKENVKDWRKADFKAIKSAINNVKWQEVFDNQGTQECWDRFSNILNRAVEDNVPTKPARKRGKPLWMQRNIMRIIRRKRRLWSHYKDTKDHQDYQAYKQAEAGVKKAVRNAKKQFEKKLSKDAKKNPKAFYKYINSKKSNRENIGPLKVDKILIDDDKSVAETLNMFFSSVFTKEDLDNLPNIAKIKDNIDDLQNINFTSEVVKKN